MQQVVHCEIRSILVKNSHSSFSSLSLPPTTALVIGRVSLAVEQADGFFATSTITRYRNGTSLLLKLSCIWIATHPDLHYYVNVCLDYANLAHKIDESSFSSLWLYLVEESLRRMQKSSLSQPPPSEIKYLLLRLWGALITIPSPA